LTLTHLCVLVNCRPDLEQITKAAHSLPKGEYKNGLLIATFMYHMVPKTKENRNQNKMTKTAFLEKAISHTHVFDWFCCFKEGCIPTKSVKVFWMCFIEQK